MPKTAAQRQAAYRARRPFAGQDRNGQRRINLWINTQADLALERLARRYCVTKQQMIERLLTAEDDRLLAAIELDSDEWKAYFNRASVTL
jgi:hypothetical protein